MFVFIDFETGGLQAWKYPILDIGMVFTTNNFDVVTAYSQRILPPEDVPIDPEAAKVNGYDREVWKESGAVSLERAAKTIMRFLVVKEKIVPVAHNAGFDKSFMPQLIAMLPKTHQDAFDYHWICTASLFQVWRILANKPGDLKLATLTKMSGFPLKRGEREEHRALPDAYACYNGFKWLLSQLRVR